MIKVYMLLFFVVLVDRVGLDIGFVVYGRFFCFGFVVFM